MSNKQSGLKAILPLFLVIFIDGMGLGIIFPILNPIYMDPVHGILSPGTSEAIRAFLYGLTLFVFPICMFFGTPVLGDLSDIVGRRKVLLICLIGATLGYLICAIGVEMHVVVLLLIGRMVAGFTAGSQSVAQAAILDVAPEDKKAFYLSWLMFPASLGFVAGPLISGYMADSSLVSWFNLTTPLYFAAIISVINAIYLLCCFKDTRELNSQMKVKLSRGLTLFSDAFSNKTIRIISLAFVFMGLGWGVYFQYASLYLTQHYHYNGQDIGLFMGVIGLGFAIGFIFVVRWMVRYFNLKLAISLAWAITAVCIFISILSDAVWPVWVCGFIIGCVMAGSYSGTLTLYSNAVSADHQGWVMGVAMSVVAFGFAVMSIVPSWLQQFAVWVPLASAGILMLICSVIMFWFFAKTRSDVTG